jgi:glycosyltransferase involved in cell wall biosynthesis
MWEQFILPGKIRPDETLWSPANTGPLVVSNQVLTLHDLSPLEHPEWFKPAFSAWYRLFLPILARRVKKVLTSSEYGRKKVLARFSLQADRVVCVPAGVDRDKFHPLAGPKEPYLLFVGTHEPRKNLSGLLRAWEMIKGKYPHFHLVVAGSMGSVFRKMVLSENLERVHFPGYIPESDLPSLYARAMLFVLPSHDEGFGLPLLEAMACGTAVIAAQAGALPEVAGDAGMLFVPAHDCSLAAAIDQCLSDSVLLASLREKGLERAAQFSWQASAEKVWQVLQACR